MTIRSREKRRFLTLKILIDVLQIAATAVALYCLLYYLIKLPSSSILPLIVPACTLTFVSCGVRLNLDYRSKFSVQKERQSPSRKMHLSDWFKWYGSTLFTGTDKPLRWDFLKVYVLSPISFIAQYYSVICLVNEESYPKTGVLLMVTGLVALLTTVKPLSRVIITQPRFRHLLDQQPESK